MRESKISDKNPIFESSLLKPLEDSLKQILWSFKNSVIFICYCFIDKITI